jgi:predicted DNA-binding protein (UPF0251 family)
MEDAFYKLGERFVRARGGVPSDMVHDIVSEAFVLMKEKGYPFQQGLFIQCLKWTLGRHNKQNKRMYVPVVAPECVDNSRDAEEVLAEIFEKLTSEEIEFFRVYSYVEQDLTKTAAILGLTRQTARTTIKRARKKIQPYIEQYGESHVARQGGVHQKAMHKTEAFSRFLPCVEQMEFIEEEPEVREGDYYHRYIQPTTSPTIQHMPESTFNMAFSTPLEVL